MNRSQQKAIDRLNEKIEKAKARKDYISALRFCQEKERLLNEAKTEERISLSKALEGYSEAERNEATALVVYMVATSDLLYSATMDVESKMKKRFGIDNIPIISKMRNIISELAKIVKTIDDVGNSVFSEKYADIVTEIEMKYKTTMMNYIHNEIKKLSNAQ